MIKLIVFDFDGTLVDTWSVIEKSIKKSLGKYGYEITEEFLDLLGNFPIERTLRKLIADRKHIKEVVLEFVLKKEKDFGKVKAVKSIGKLKKIKQKKIILSNNVSGFIEKVLKNLKINFFNEVYGADMFKSKESKLKKIIEKAGLKVSEVMYVGDRPVDVQLAKSVGCICVAVSQKASWSSKKELIKEEPDFLIGDLSELVKIVDKLDKI